MENKYINEVNSNLFTTWEDNYSKAIELYNSDVDTSYDSYIIDLIITAHQCGLNVLKSRNKFLNSSLILAKLYFKYKNYKLAENNLLLLREIKDENLKTPTWINFYSIITYYKLQLESVIRNPENILNEIDSLQTSNNEEYLQKISIIDDLFNNVSDFKQSNPKFDFSIFNSKIEQWKEKNSLIFSENNFLQHSDNSNNIDEVKPFVEINEYIHELENELKKFKEENNQLKCDIEEFKKQSSNIILPVNSLVSEIRSFIKPRQLLIITDKTLSKEIILGICKGYGYDKKNIKIFDDYGKLPFTFESLRYNSPYDGVIFGAVPHSMPGKGNYSSPIEMLKNEEGYPRVEESKTISGELKLTKESLKNSLKRLNTYLDAIN